MKWGVFIVGAGLCLEGVTQNIMTKMDFVRASGCVLIGAGLVLAALLL